MQYIIIIMGEVGFNTQVRINFLRCYPKLCNRRRLEAVVYCKWCHPFIYQQSDSGENRHWGRNTKLQVNFLLSGTAIAQVQLILMWIVPEVFTKNQKCRFTYYFNVWNLFCGFVSRCFSSWFIEI